MADLIELAHRLHYAAYSFGFEAGKVGQHVDTTIAGNKAAAALNELLRAIAVPAVCKHCGAIEANGETHGPRCPSRGVNAGQGGNAAAELANIQSVKGRRCYGVGPECRRQLETSPERHECKQDGRCIFAPADGVLVSFASQGENHGSDVHRRAAARREACDAGRHEVVSRGGAGGSGAGASDCAIPQADVARQIGGSPDDGLEHAAGLGDRRDGTPAHATVAAPPAEPELCHCDKHGFGEPGVSCGDCPTRDYKRTRGVSVGQGKPVPDHTPMESSGGEREVNRD